MSTIKIPTMACTPSAFGMPQATALSFVEGAVSRHASGLATGLVNAIEGTVRRYAATQATAAGIPAWRPPLS